MSQERHKPTQRSATEYRLSITSNSESRRSSLGGTTENASGASMKPSRPGAGTGSLDDGESIVHEFILPQIREFSDSMITLDANFTQLNFIHESLVDLNESLGSLLYGLMCNSWCVDFPHVSHDIEEELQTTRRLEALKEERVSLMEQLDVYREIRNGNNCENATNSTKTFMQPLPLSKMPRQRLFRSHPSGNEDEDENASEASFVSNPTLTDPLREIDKPRPKNAGKLRRKSILRTIRSSLSSTDFSEDRLGFANNAQHTRLSLGGGATRLVTNSPPSKRTAQPRMARASEAELQESRRTLENRRRTLESRPPFR